MKITKGQINLSGKIYEATEIDYNSYSTQSGTIILDSKTYNAIKALGLESAPGDRTICSNSTICSNTTLVKA